MTNELYDDHYRGKKIEPIEVQEQIMRDLTNVPPEKRHLIAQVARYILRMGTKEGEPWEKDAKKALNYMYRSVYGEWIPNGEFKISSALDCANTIIASQISDINNRVAINTARLMLQATPEKTAQALIEETKPFSRIPDELDLDEERREFDKWRG